MPYRLKDVFPRGHSKDEYRQVIADEVRHQTDAYEYLLQSRSWDFYIAYYSATAMAQHYFWSDLEAAGAGASDDNAVLDAYKAVDAAVGRLMVAAGPNTICFVISECGAGPLTSGVRINAMLEQQGLLRHRQAGRQKSNPLRAMVARATVEAKQYAQQLLPPSWLFRLNRGVLRRWMQRNAIATDVDWNLSDTYYHGKGEGNVYVNLLGRERSGRVATGNQYEAVRDAVIERIGALVDPASGAPAVDGVYRREDLYQGPHVASAPDLIVAWRGFAYMPDESAASDKADAAVFVPRWREYMRWPTTGSHRMHGLFLAAGPGVQRRHAIGEVALLDLAPTWLALLRVPIPAALEGRPLANRLLDLGANP